MTFLFAPTIKLNLLSSRRALEGNWAWQTGFEFFNNFECFNVDVSIMHGLSNSVSFISRSDSDGISPDTNVMDPSGVYSSWSTVDENVSEVNSNHSDKSDLHDLVASILGETPSSPEKGSNNISQPLNWQRLAQKQASKVQKPPSHSYSANRNVNQEKLASIGVARSVNHDIFASGDIGFRSSSDMTSYNPDSQKIIGSAAKSVNSAPATNSSTNHFPFPPPLIDTRMEFPLRKDSSLPDLFRFNPSSPVFAPTPHPSPADLEKLRSKLNGAQLIPEHYGVNKDEPSLLSGPEVPPKPLLLRDSDQVDGETFQKLIAMATDGLQAYVARSQEQIQNEDSERDDAKFTGNPSQENLALTEEFIRYRQSLYQNSMKSPAEFNMRTEGSYPNIPQANFSSPMPRGHSGPEIYQQQFAQARNSAMMNAYQNNLTQEQMIQAKFRELGIGNGTPPPPQQMNWPAYQNLSADLLQLRSLDPTKQLMTPKKMINPDYATMQSFYSGTSPAFTNGNPAVRSAPTSGKHAFQPVRQMDNATYQHLSSPWNKPNTPNNDAPLGSLTSNRNSFAELSGYQRSPSNLVPAFSQDSTLSASDMLSPTASMNGADALNGQKSPPFRPISSQLSEHGTPNPMNEGGTPETTNFLENESPTKNVASQNQEQKNVSKPSEVSIDPATAPTVTSTAQFLPSVPNMNFPMQFANTFSPYQQRLPHGIANMMMTRPIMCSPNSAIPYSPVAPNFIPVLTDRGWMMMPADKMGTPVPGSSMTATSMVAGKSMQQLELLKMRRDIPRYKMHICMEECYYQFRCLERERKLAESELAQNFPGRRVTSCNNTPMPRLPPHPTKADRLIVDQLREHGRITTLIDRMEHLLEGPLPANLTNYLEKHYKAVKDAEAKRREEINSKHNSPGSPVLPQDADNDEITKALADSLELLTQTTRKSRTAVWCALQITISTMKNKDVDEEVAKVMTSLTLDNEICPKVDGHGYSDAQSPTAAPINRIKIGELYKVLSAKSLNRGEA